MTQLNMQKALDGIFQEMKETDRRRTEENVNINVSLAKLQTEVIEMRRDMNGNLKKTDIFITKNCPAKYERLKDEINNNKVTVAWIMGVFATIVVMANLLIIIIK